MGDELVDSPEEDAAGEKTDDGGEPGDASFCPGHGDGRRQERPIGRGNHHPGGEAEHAVEELAVDGAKEEAPRRP